MHIRQFDKLNVFSYKNKEGKSSHSIGATKVAENLVAGFLEKKNIFLDKFFIYISFTNYLNCDVIDDYIYVQLRNWF